MQVQQVAIEFYTVKALCERYGVQPVTLRRWIAIGQFPPPLRIGRRKVLWPVALVQEHERRLQSAAAANIKPEPKVKNYKRGTHEYRNTQVTG